MPNCQFCNSTATKTQTLVIDLHPFNHKLSVDVCNVCDFDIEKFGVVSQLMVDEIAKLDSGVGGFDFDYNEC